tara:strand:- start:154 stop:462 length:309 start_codon:yes stop_codon:yes gene_type:complete
MNQPKGLQGKMQNQKQTDKIKKQLEKLSTVMQRIEQVAKEEISSNEEYLQVCGALLAVTRNMYVEALGPFDASRMFEAVAQSFHIQEELIEFFREGESPTIH